MDKLSQITTGKAKSLFSTAHPDQLIMEFRDDTSAFDGKKMEALDNKGNVNNQFNAFVMEFLATKGIETHFIELLSSNESLVKKLDMFPIECVVRNRATGSLCKRLGIEDGLILDPPLFEFFLKDDALGDPLINDHHIVSFGWASQEEADTMRELTLQANDILVNFFSEANLILVDYKLEFGMFQGKMLLADEFTPDGCRLWDKDTLAKMDKDRFRQDLGNVIETYSEVAERLGMQIKLD
ncbi:phosphoribosylaminoimidazolesuccinocarboxamide synthase [Gammaproteobacteria bacterium]|jgi:phosphoribosylaminoimidazole-succinocarboxamide synthase|nr:phosphoribosylaminoimidazolesuccinocarboxamide synthase [Gammaproteobacteria bacterium]MDA9049044.1 phosphoribosylaminoimidazolesuccinocarboxamide synthase [Gammaproteobacteria bacterium]MDA9153985.1 phosphoribosylaminoimidazolesuccinocarboxamide synthase [Gammaproteobacteria bacterium]MDA9371412.1 phosphoribosylaminoimidazolesuccinocarboxamide synthase [Gammaproteobacteria bacterium]MDC1525373.1 phosphoribosylaminoimidazolesuccinocarboxamide synthase [Gammaproteobacteria bacterium]